MLARYRASMLLKHPKRPNKGSSEPKLHFTVDAGLLFQLGEQLVARRSIALGELIKNSYDADATRVDVTFLDITQPNGTIVVKDDGHGMTFEEIERSWMRIAYSDKIRSHRSRIFCRPLSGAKGIGRFACRRLAQALDLDSVAVRPDKTRERVHVKFDWQEFTSGRPIDRVGVNYSREPVDDTMPTGVTLTLQRVRDIWTREDASELTRDIVTLTSPFPDKQQTNAKTPKGCQADPGFQIALLSEEFPEQSGSLSEQFLANAWRLEGEVSQSGFPRYTLSIPGRREKRSFKPSDGNEQPWFALKGCRFIIYFMVYKTDFVEGTGINLRTAITYGRDHGGVRIYLDNFRVFPYGDPGDDWLGLDQLKASRSTRLPSMVETAARGLRRPLLNIPGNNQLFGAVYISQTKHPGLQLTINRERLIEGEAFYDLIEFVRTGIYWLTVEYARVNTRSREDKNEQAEQAKQVSETIERIEEAVKNRPEINEDVREEVLHLVGQAREAVREREQEQISELSLLRILASAGTMIVLFAHQLRGLVDGLERIYHDLQYFSGSLVGQSRRDYSELLEELNEWRSNVEDQAKQIGVLVGYDSRSRRRRLVVNQVVEGVYRPLSGYTRRFGVDVENDVPPYLRTPPMFEAELHALLLNLFTNALKAVRNQPIRRIRIDAHQADNSLIIRMLDTGVGLDVAQREAVFRPLVTTSTPDPVLGVGTGIGLAVVGDIMYGYRGEAKFVDAESPWMTAIELVFPLGSED